MEQAITGKDAGAVEVHIDKGVAEISIVNPPLNVMSGAVLRSLDAVLDRLDAAPDVQALIVRGRGEKAFSAGSNIKEFPEYLDKNVFVTERLNWENHVYSKLARFRTPTIAAIDGVALGGGLELAVCCDLLVCSSRSQFALPEILIGGFPGTGGTVRVQKRIGLARTSEMMFLGDTISAEKALLWGLVNAVVDGASIELARSWARRLSAAPPVALEACKKALQKAQENSESTAILESLNCSLMIEKSADFREGVSAFIEKRQPIFQQRP